MFHWIEFTPKLFTCWKEGFTRKQILQDILAGITVGIISIPLAMAFAIGAGVSPERGLFTAIIAGFLISLLGGSRVQIGGPTGAYIVIIFDIIQRHGYEGLAISTLMAGVMLIGMGLLRFGVLLKYIPYPVTTGFTTGLALNIFTGQVKDLFGLAIDQVPSRFINRWSLYFEQASTWNPWAFVIAALTLSLIVILRWRYPKVPGSILAIVCATFAVIWFELPLETIQSKFGQIPRMLPAPSFPSFSLQTLVELFPDALTVALLGAIESLLSAHVADGMTGQRHRSNCELVAQGFANIGSIIFGGIPATGAIARTTANINLNATTPIAGMTHAVTILALMLFFAPLASLVPLASLAAVLTMVAWNMSERHHFVEILKGSWSDILVLIITFALTVLVDLTVAVQAGVLIAALLFLKQMSATTKLRKKEMLPDGVFLYEMDGPLFFGVSHLLHDELLHLTTDTLIIDMGKVPFIDASGVHALKQLHKKCQKKGMTLSLTSLHSEVKQPLEKAGLLKAIKPEQPMKDSKSYFATNPGQ